jgi:hypothetical protein
VKLSARQSALGGVLLLAGIGWGVDAFTQAGPRPARASPSSPSPPLATPTDWQDADALIARLTQANYRPVAEALTELPRDVFLPLSGPIPPDTPAAPGATPAPSASADAAPATPDFVARHVLKGVVLGPVPTAIVDDRLLAPGDVLEDYRLLDVQSAAVLFEPVAGGEPVRLELQGAPGE